MKFSMILATLGGEKSIGSCLDSLLNQTYCNYEIIIIDQNFSNNTKKIINNYKDARIRYFQVDFTGLSKARNFAIVRMTGDYAVLIDDDAYYDNYFLEVAANYLGTNKDAILSGNIFDMISQRNFARYDTKYNNKKLPLHKILDSCPSAALVLPRKVITKINGFDEEFGIGATYGAAEETDFLVRAVENGFYVVYIDKMKVKHPVPISNERIMTPDKHYRYSRGIGAFYKKNIINFRDVNLVFFFTKRLLREAAIYIFSFSDRDGASHRIKGLIDGMKDYQGKMFRE